MAGVTHYLQEVWRYRRFYTALAWLDLRRRFRRSILGMSWALIQPALMAGVMCGIFCQAFGSSFREHFPYVLVGVCTWSYFTAAVQQGCSCIFWSETYIRQHRAPLAIYPLRVVLGGLGNLGLACLPVLLWSWLGHAAVSLPGLLGLVVLAPLLLLFGWALATLFGFAYAYAPDVSPLADLGLQILFYATPILYQPALLSERGMGWLLDLNPVFGMLTAVRAVLLDGAWPPAAALLQAALVTAVLVALAGLTLARLERKVIFHL